MIFRYHAEIQEKFPQARAGVLVVQGLKNGPTPPELLAKYQAEQAKVKAAIGETPLSELTSLSAWRGAFRKFGVKPTKYRSAVEALLRRLTKKGDIPSINFLVDAGNLLSIRYQIPVAVFDTGQTAGSITVRLARGDEAFTPLFATEVEHPVAGEVIFADEEDIVLARRWCWRQSDQSAAKESTTQAVICFEAQHEDGAAVIAAAMADWEAMLAEYTEATWVTGVVDAGNAEVSG